MKITVLYKDHFGQFSLCSCGLHNVTENYHKSYCNQALCVSATFQLGFAVGKATHYFGLLLSFHSSNQCSHTDNYCTHTMSLRNIWIIHNI